MAFASAASAPGFTFLPAREPEESMWRWTVSPEKAPNRAEYIDLEYRKGDIVAINGKSYRVKEAPVVTQETKKNKKSNELATAGAAS